MKKRYLITALIGAMALAGCGNLTKSPAEGLTFKAPAGFNSQLSAMGVMQVWTKGSGADVQAMMLFRSPISGKSWSVDDAMKNAKVNGGDVVAHQKITICGHEAALFAHVQGSMNANASTPTKKNSNIEIVITQSAQPIMALYSYPLNTAPDPAAEAAIHNLCSAPAGQ